jgi:hypothetical protein
MTLCFESSWESQKSSAPAARFSHWGQRFFKSPVHPISNSSNDPKMKRSDIVCVRIYIYNYLHTPGCLILGKLIGEKGRSWEANPNPSLSPKKKGPPDRACTLPLSK